MATIVVIGAGVVGSATARGFLRRGHDVSIVDIDPDCRARLRQEGLQVSSRLLPPHRQTFYFLALPTPATADGGYDLSALCMGVEALGIVLRDAGPGHVVVVRSTVPPGTTEGLIQSLLEEASGGTVGTDFEVASAPEFLRERSALEDFCSPQVTVIAARSPLVRAGLQGLLAPFGGHMSVFEDPRTAEVIKVVHNAFNATKISFWNEVWSLCSSLDIDSQDVAEVVAVSAEGSTNIHYGIRGGAPFDGSCLPKDLDGLLYFASAGEIPLTLLSAVRQVNRSMKGAMPATGAA